MKEKIKKIQMSVKNTIVLKKIMGQPLSLREIIYNFFRKGTKIFHKKSKIIKI